jgi:hypothetical protein
MAYSFYETLQSLLLSSTPSSTTIPTSSSLPSPHSSSTPSHDLPISDLYRILSLLKNSFHSVTDINSSSLYQEMLYLLFLQTQSYQPNYSHLILWMKSHLSLIILPKDLKILFQYLKYFLPLSSETASRAEIGTPNTTTTIFFPSKTELYQKFQLLDPLKLTQLTELPKKVWCEQIEEYLNERKILISQDNKKKRFLSSVRSTCLSSFMTPTPSPSVSPKAQTSDVVTETQNMPSSAFDGGHQRQDKQRRMWGAFSLTKVYPLSGDDVDNGSSSQEQFPIYRHSQKPIIA